MKALLLSVSLGCIGSIAGVITYVAIRRFYINRYKRMLNEKYGIWAQRTDLTDDDL